jgi:hypothetical protein
VSHVEGANLRFKDTNLIRQHGKLSMRTGRLTWM